MVMYTRIGALESEHGDKSKTATSNVTERVRVKPRGQMADLRDKCKKINKKLPQETLSTDA